MKLLAKIEGFLANPRNFLLTLAIFVATLLTLLGAIKYALFLYNGVDLAYFNQVLWNTVQGRPFVQSIHPHLSLGDHAEFALLAIAAPYAIIRHPITLIALQALAITLPALAIFSLSKHKFGKNQPFPAAALAISLAWLLNASIHGIALFEFHVLPFALGPLLLAAIAYERRNLAKFLLWCAVAMLVREDVALAVVSFGLLAMLEKRSIKWILTPIVAGLAYFAAAMAVISHFAPAGSYKFAVYYSWLGDTPLQMLAVPFTKPLTVLGHLFSIGNLEMILALLMPVAFLPLLAPKRLILALGPLAIIVLNASGGSSFVAETHYATLLLPAIFLASIDGISVAQDVASRYAFRTKRHLVHHVPYAALAVCVTYSMLALGPVPHVIAKTLDRDAIRTAAAAKEALSVIDDDESVAASYSLLPALSSRENLYSTHYLFLGTTQFAEQPYQVPSELRRTVFDERDLEHYEAQYSRSKWARAGYEFGRDRLSVSLGPEVFSSGPFAIHDRFARPVSSAFRTPLQSPQGNIWREEGFVRFVKVSPWSGDEVTHLQVSAVFSAPDSNTHEYRVLISQESSGGKVLAVDKRPLLKLASNPAEGSRIERSYDVLLGSDEVDAMAISLFRERYVYALDGTRTAQPLPIESELVDSVRLQLAR